MKPKPNIIKEKCPYFGPKAGEAYKIEENGCRLTSPKNSNSANDETLRWKCSTRRGDQHSRFALFHPEALTHTNVRFSF